MGSAESIFLTDKYISGVVISHKNNEDNIVGYYVSPLGPNSKYKFEPVTIKTMMLGEQGSQTMVLEGGETDIKFPNGYYLTNINKIVSEVGNINFTFIVQNQSGDIKKIEKKMLVYMRKGDIPTDVTPVDYRSSCNKHIQGITDREDVMMGGENGMRSTNTFMTTCSGENNIAATGLNLSKQQKQGLLLLFVIIIAVFALQMSYGSSKSPAKPVQQHVVY